MISLPWSARNVAIMPMATTSKRTVEMRRVFRISLPKMAAELIRHVSAEESNADKSPMESNAASGNGSAPETRRKSGLTAAPVAFGANVAAHMPSKTIITLKMRMAKLPAITALRAVLESFATRFLEMTSGPRK